MNSGSLAGAHVGRQSGPDQPDPGVPGRLDGLHRPGHQHLAHLDDARGCHAVVGAKILAGGGPGFTGLAYRSSDHRLSFAAGGKGLFVQSATAQCDNGAAGLDVKQFDRISLGGFGDSIADSSAIISPAQRISSP
jgi:hypothetical protein